MNECKNPTCTRAAKMTYCSRQCQLAMKTVTKGRALPDVWVEMDTWWALVEAAEVRNLNIRDYVVSVVEMELEKTGQLELVL